MILNRARRAVKTARAFVGASLDDVRSKDFILNEIKRLRYLMLVNIQIKTKRAQALKAQKAAATATEAALK